MAWISWVSGSIFFSPFTSMQQWFDENVKRPQSDMILVPAVADLVEDAATKTLNTIYWPDWKLPTIEQVVSSWKGSIVNVKV